MRVFVRTVVLTLLISALLAGLLATAAVPAPQSLQAAYAERFSHKIEAIVRRSLEPRAPSLRTPITENEINAYFALYGRQELPAGVVDPRVSILDGRRVSGRATIDLDAVRRASSGGWLDPASYLRGRVPMSAQGILQANNGVARFELESAQVAGISVPKSILQQVVSHYSRTPDYPNGVNLDDPFPLPAGIKMIQMSPGQAVVVQ